MLSKKLLMTLLFAAPVLVPAQAWAQDEDEDEEESTSSKKSKKKEAEDEDEVAPKAEKEETAKIREIQRGFYAKTNVGAGFYPLSQAINPGTSVSLAIGQDFVDQEKMSMAWELGLWQGLHNGVDILVQNDNGGCQIVGGAFPCTEGDLRTYTLALNYEYSFYPTRRVGIGVRVGAGAMYSPLLITKEYYESDIVTEIGADPGLHNSIHPYFFGGPTLEYYTKLSHFSVGIDADVSYALNWDLGINGTAFLKYTF